MTDYADLREKVAFAIYNQFIRGGVGTCTTYKRGSEAVKETPEDAAKRRWHFAQPSVKESFRREADAAIKAGSV